MLDEQMLPDKPPALARSLGVAGVLFLTLSATTPASSVFVIIPGMLQEAGTGAIWAMILASLICVTTAFIYAELSSAWPVAGGEYVAVAQTLGPMAGFVMLGVNVFNNVLFPPVAALGIASVMATVVPGLPAVPVAVAVMIGSTLVAILNIRVNAVITGLFLLVELAAVAVVMVLGFADHARPALEFLTDPVVAAAGQGFVPASAASIGVATTIAIFALNGYGMAVYFGEEMHEAPRRIAGTILAALGLALLFEGVPLLALLLARIDLATLLAVDDPFGLLVRQRGSAGLSALVSVGIVLAIVNAIIACVLACARFFYSTGRDRAWIPRIDDWLVAIHPRFDSPWIGTLIVGGMGTLACFLPLSMLLVLNGTGLVAIYGGIALAAMAGRRSGASAHAPYRMPLYPLAPVVTLLALAYVVWTSWLDAGEGRPGLIATAAQIAGSVLWYKLVLCRRGQWKVQT
ncbi:APC family permease [Sphingobium sp. RSMS]|uniref:APC family permease n=1 Tax=Sphingobium sp. RSMS TaxID=520734 RepID=UPI0020A583CF|nr:APC family permease [Sphingobium sp. RSMS]UXC89932.1 APC family permease [Sphingobium sp. RSMS]